MLANEIKLAPKSGLIKIKRFSSVEKTDDGPPAAQLIQRRNELNELFEKKFEYQKNDKTEWNLPKATELFKEFYQIEELQNLKIRLNMVKSKLNNYIIEDWSIHTKRKDPAGEIPWRLKTETQAEFVTVAWCKFFECLNRFPIVQSPKINSLHLCEAPGAFIAAFNHYLNTKFQDNYQQIEWKWLSTTLNPYYEGNPLTKMINDNRFILMTLDHWAFHNDFTGNILDIKNIESLEKQCQEYFNNEEIHLITADGSIDCVSAPDCQEEFVDNLNLAEILTALLILSEKGSLVIKLFTQFEATTVSKMFLLNCVFESVNVFKPATSKRGNSEMYIICLGYKKKTENLQEILQAIKTKLTNPNEVMLPLFSRKYLPADFLFQHEVCQRLFMNLQIKAIENNIFTYEIKTKYDNQYAHRLRTEVCNEYYRRYNVQPIPKERTILYGSDNIPLGEKIILYKGSHSEREMLKTTGKEEQVFKLQSNLNDLEKALGRKYGILYHEERFSQPYDTNDLQLKIFKGTPIQSIHNSLFMAASVLNMRTKFQDIFELDPLWFDSPQCDLGNGITINFDFYKTKDFTPLQQNFFVEVLNGIIEHKPKNLIFKNFPFVTHYSVSILRYLYLNFYPSLSIYTEAYYQIVLENPVDDLNVKVLEDLRDTLLADQRILCILALEKLHQNPFKTSLIEFNNILVLKNSNKILDPKDQKIRL